MRRTLLALVAVLALANGCGQGPSARISVTLVEIEAGVDATDGASAEPTMARCCALQVADAATGDAAISGGADSCSVLARNGLGVVEPCLSGSAGGTYGLWTCGTTEPQMRCGDHGFTCSPGDPCTLVDVGCPGVVQECAFTPSAPPPG